MTVEGYSILAHKQLQEIDRLLQTHLRGLETELETYENIIGLDAEELRRISRNTRIVSQLFVIDGENEYVFPPQNGELSAKEAEFLETSKELELPLILGAGASQAEPVPAQSSGWYTWFLNEGVHFLHWQSRADGYRTGVVIDRIAFISRILGVLPDSDFSVQDEYKSRVVLTDARGGVLYQWGLYSPGIDEQPVAVTALTRPLAAWRLQMYFDSETDLPFFSRYGALLTGIAAGVAVVILIAVYFYRENKKIVEDALQKVSFVNQVSHELRTPLTNIRLYSEMILEKLTDEKEKDRARVVLSESERLSRMITNVLSFSRIGRNKLSLKLAETNVDDTIRRVAESFALSLKNKSIRISLKCSAPSSVKTDADCVEQILSNLIGNVEKYASSGGYLEIESLQNRRFTVIYVRDRGPGIPPGERKRIFEPFYRISNKLNDGVSGTGIGLAVSRSLAEKIGGSLTLEENWPGAVFKLEIPNDATLEEG